MDIPTFLLIDDDLQFCEYIRAISSSLNVHYDEAHTLKEARALIKNENYKAIFIDSRLQDKSGLNDIKDLHPYAKETPFIYMTAVDKQSTFLKKLKHEFHIDYVLFKPVKSEDFLQLITVILNPPKYAEEEKDILFKVRKKYLASIPDILEHLETLVHAIEIEPTLENIKKLGDETHKIAGTAGTFGYKKVTDICRKIDTQCKLVLQQGSVDSYWVLSLENFLDQVKFYFQIPERTIEHEEKDDFKTLHRIPLYVVDADRRFIEVLNKLRQEGNLDVITELDPNEALEKLKDIQFNPQVLLVSQTFYGQSLDGYTLIQTSKERKDALPTFYGLLISEKSSQKSRLEDINKGVDFVITKPVSIEILVNTINLGLKSQMHHQYAVLLVDDDQDFCEIVSLTLQAAGMDVVIKKTGDNLIEEILLVRPDILILDIFLPDINGMELLKLIRSDMRLINMYIVIATVSQDQALIQTALKNRADDIISKPINLEQFKYRILNLARRKHLIDRNMEHDPTTGLYLAKTFFNYFEHKFANSETIKGGESLAVIEIDNFARLNLTDERERQNLQEDIAVLFSNLIFEGLARVEIDAYLGEGRFILGFDGIDYEDLKQSIESFLNDAQKIMQTNLKLNFTPTFSCGVAYFTKSNFQVHNVYKYALEALQSVHNHVTPIKIGLAGQTVPLKDITRDILIVDDDPVILEMLTYALEREGFSVKTFMTGRDFLDYVNHLRTHLPETPPLIVLDRLLPDYDGIELIRILKQERIMNFPILFLSTLSAEKDILAGLREGALDYITKPFNAEIFLQKVKTLFHITVG